MIFYICFYLLSVFAPACRAAGWARSNVVHLNPPIRTESIWAGLSERSPSGRAIIKEIFFLKSRVCCIYLREVNNEQNGINKRLK